MSHDDGEVYLMSDEGEEGWMSPRPAGVAIVDAVAAATGLSESDIGDIEAYVDLAELAATLDDGRSHTFTVEGHEVTVDPSGDIDVAD